MEVSKNIPKQKVHFQYLSEHWSKIVSRTDRPTAADAIDVISEHHSKHALQEQVLLLP